MQTEVELAAITDPMASPVDRYSDLDLQLSRRLDWRFLLPDSHLGKIAYLGEPKNSLVAALERFSESLTVVSDANLSGSFDGVVISSPAAPRVEQASRMLSKDGWLYLEAGSAARWHLPFLRAELRSFGFRDVRAYWHRPSFEACREIVPLENNALDYVFSRQHKDIAGSLKAIAAVLAKRTGLLALVTPNVSLIGCKN